MLHAGMPPPAPVALARASRRRPNDDRWRLTCRHLGRRQEAAATVSGGKLHVSPGGATATEYVVFFVNSIRKWSFLSMNWARWSLLGKYLTGEGSSHRCSSLLR
jgi:hypothetical protein